MNAQRSLDVSQSGMQKSLERLSSGYRINSAKDDAAGLAISQGFRANIASVKVAQRNITEANALLQVAEGAMSNIGDILTRMKELATQAASANVGTDITKVAAEYDTLVSEIDRIASSTKYAGTSLLTGLFSAGNTGGFGALTAGGAGTADDTYFSDSTVKDLGVSDLKVTNAAVGIWTAAASGSALTLTNAAGNLSQTVTIGNEAGTVNFDALGISFMKTAATTEVTTMTFKDLLAGEGITIAGRIFTAGASGASASQIATAFVGAGTGSAALGGTITAGAAAGYTVTAGASGSALFTSTTVGAGALTATVTGTTPAEPNYVYTQGANATTEVATMAFTGLANGETIIIAGRTFTASGAASAADVATAFAGGLVANGTITGNLAGYTASASTAAGITLFTSMTVGAQSDLAYTGTVTGALSVSTQGADATTEVATMTFTDLADQQTVTIAGRTFTASGTAAAANVATAFAGGAVVGGTITGNLAAGYTATASTASGITLFTSTTVGAQSDLAATVTGTTPETPIGSAVTGEDIVAAIVTAGTLTVTAGETAAFQVGYGNVADNDQLGVVLASMKAVNLSTSGTGGLVAADIESSSKAFSAMTKIDDAISTLSAKRGELGAYQNRLGYASSNLASTLENFTAAESSIRDVDMAAEMTNFTKNQILVQAGTAMLAQANAAPQQILSLLKG